MTINSITKDFNIKAQQLINDGTEAESIITKLNWDKSAFSLVRNSKRNIPIEKYELFMSVFKSENVVEKKENGNGNGAHIEAVDILKSNLSDLKSNLSDLRTHINLLERSREQKNDYINQLKIQIEELKKHNEVLKEEVKANLQIVLENQIAHEAAMEARQDTILELVAKPDNDLREVFETVDKKYVELGLAYDGKDMRLKIGTFGKK